MSIIYVSRRVLGYAKRWGVWQAVVTAMIRDTTTQELRYYYYYVAKNGDESKLLKDQPKLDRFTAPGDGWENVI